MEKTDQGVDVVALERFAVPDEQILGRRVEGCRTRLPGRERRPRTLQRALTDAVVVSRMPATSAAAQPRTSRRISTTGCRGGSS